MVIGKGVAKWVVGSIETGGSECGVREGVSSARVGARESSGLGSIRVEGMNIATAGP